jgi:hypothetical protein
LTSWATISPSTMTALWTYSSPYNTFTEAQGERMYSSYSFTTSALDRGEWSASRPRRAIAPWKDPRYPLYRRLCGPQSRSGHRGKISCLCRGSNVDRPVVQSVARHYTAWVTRLLRPTHTYIELPVIGINAFFLDNNCRPHFWMVQLFTALWRKEVMLLGVSRPLSVPRDGWPAPSCTTWARLHAVVSDNHYPHVRCVNLAVPIKF